jgi:hypothetical protein
VFTQKQVKQLTEHARERIACGASPQQLAHGVSQGEDAYVSTPLPLGGNLDGLTAHYKTLEAWARLDETWQGIGV